MENAKKEFWSDWFAGASFTTDWSSRAFNDWDAHLSELRQKDIEILEIGSWEGRSSIFFLNYFPFSRIDCVDIFLLGNESLFDSNVMQKYRDRVGKHKSRSIPLLDAFATRERRSFDLIYIDGAHERDDVMVDTILAWRLLKVGGVLIWDDYDILNAMPDHFTKDQDPKPAIDAFLAWRTGEYEITHFGYQVIIRKTKPHYETEMTLLDPALNSSTSTDAVPPIEKRLSLAAIMKSALRRSQV
ncbi:class I SAM-dependent methyltransferase [Agrobacterium tumefaciens]|uniref:class I SAM-dependent methyltransferase n=1 Tax=Agrobacterium tumefaciens TaxID=358 RepID=UPI0016442F0F|nr:class I SAM-dependent methyltransferase [Agrobacterium tumefaciens]